MAKDAPFLYTTELENMVSLCIRVLEGSNYDVRCAVAKLLGQLAASTQHMVYSIKTFPSKFYFLYRFFLINKSYLIKTRLRSK